MNKIISKNKINLDEMFPNINNDIEHAVTYFSDRKNPQPSITVLTEGYEACDKDKMKLGPTKYNYFILHYIFNGSGHLIYKNSNNEKVTIKVNKKELFLISPKKEFTYYPDKNDPWEYAWICFMTEGDVNVFSQVLNFGEHVMKLKNYKSVEKAFLKVKNISNYKFAKNTAALAVFYEALSEIVENCTSTIGPDSGKNHLKECLLYVQANYTNPNLSLKEISNNLYLNEKYLSRLFSAYMGISLFKYINSLRIKKACIELTKPNVSINSISLAVGFSDSLYFSKKFKQTIGVSPSNYRKYLSK